MANRILKITETESGTMIYLDGQEFLGLPSGKLSFREIEDTIERYRNRFDAVVIDERKIITVTVEGGVIQDISGIPAGVRVVVMDFDTDGAEEEDGEPLPETTDGNKYIESIYVDEDLNSYTAPDEGDDDKAWDEFKDNATPEEMAEFKKEMADRKK